MQLLFGVHWELEEEGCFRPERAACLGIEVLRRACLHENGRRILPSGGGRD